MILHNGNNRWGIIVPQVASRAAWLGMLWYAMVCYGMLWYAIVSYGMLWYAMVCYSIIWYAIVDPFSLSMVVTDLPHFPVPNLVL